MAADINPHQGNPARRDPARGHTDNSFPDDSRTTRMHAGESVADSRNWPGMILFGLGIVLVALTLTAAGYGFEGWAILAGIACGLCLVLGTSIIILEHRRVKSLEGRKLSDQRGH